MSITKNFMKKLMVLIGFILLSQFAGIIGSLFTFSAIPSWYSLLNKPFFSPPNWLFGPVWVILYLLMGVSAFLVWNSKIAKKLKKHSLNMFYIQLFLNSMWSIIFFGLKSPFWAFIEISFLWSFILITIISFNKINRLAAIIMIPYILWVTFASFLNFSIVILN